MPGTLDEVEAVVVAAEGAPSLEAAANALRRPEDDGAVELPGAMRWVRRRVRLVHTALVRVIGLISERLGGCAATMVAVRERLGSDSALTKLRELVAAQLPMLLSPLGFPPHGIGVPGRRPAFQHSMGPDGRTPLEQWALASAGVRYPDATLDLDEVFLFEATRVVHKDRTVSLNGRLYEVDAILVGQRVTHADT